MNNKRAIGLTPRQLLLLDGFFWNRCHKHAFLYYINEFLGNGAGTAEEILRKLGRANADAIQLEAQADWLETISRQDRLDWFHRQLDKHTGEDVS